MCMHDMQTAVGIPVVTIVHIFVWLPPGLHLYPATTLTLPSPLSLWTQPIVNNFWFSGKQFLLRRRDGQRCR